MEKLNFFTKIKSYYLLIIIGLSFITRFIFFGHPNEIVFDEVTFGKFMQSMWRGEYYFDLHPPLGKLLLYLGYSFFNPDLSFTYDKIGTPFIDSTFIGMRLLTTTAGFFIPIFVYSILDTIQPYKLVAFLGAFLVIFENSGIVVSRFFMFDIFLLFFMFGSLALFFKLKLSSAEKIYDYNRKEWLQWVGVSILATATFSIKWTGFSILGFLVLYEWIESYKKSNWFFFCKKIVVLILVSFSFYYLQFMIHFQMLPKGGMGNDFMTPQFQRSLKGSRFENYSQFEELSTVQKFLELNHMMSAYHKTMNQTHPYASTAIDWLTLKRPIYYWEKGPLENKARIYSLGNPLTWWLGAISILIIIQKVFLNSKKNLLLFLNSAENYKSHKLIVNDKKNGVKSKNLYKDKKNYNSKKSEPAILGDSSLILNKESIFNPDFIILILFCANFVPFFFIGRVMFIYHYMPALTFSLMSLAILFGGFLDKLRLNWLYLFFFFILVVGVFLFFSPLTYGFPLTAESYKLRIWIQSWI